MYDNWYQKKSNKTKRNPIVLADGESFKWQDTTNVDGSYNIITIHVGENVHNFYLWSDKTTKTAKSLYNKGSFKKSLNILKKYSFEANTLEEKNGDVN